MRRKTPAGLPVPFVETDSFPRDYPEAALAVFEKIGDPVGPVQVPGFYLLLGERTGETVFVGFVTAFPHFPAGAVPKAHVHGAFPVFVEAGDTVIGLPDPHLPGVVFQQGRDVVPGEDFYLLEGRAQDREAVVAA